MTLPRHLREIVTTELAGKRLFPDVSVLLSGVLEPQSASGDVFASAAKATIVLSAHVEETAVAVLRASAPHLVAEFNDGLLRLGRDVTIERIPKQAPVEARAGAPTLSEEDRQVLSDAVGGRSQILLSHDSRLFRAAPPPLVTRSPSSIAWSPLDGANVQRGGVDSTFVGLFYPEWSSEAVSGTDERFYFFEISGFVRAYYDAKRGTAIFEWDTQVGSRGSLRMPLSILAGSYHFVAAVLRPSSVLLYADGITREKKVHIGSPANDATFHPFMSVLSQGQVCAGPDPLRHGTCHGW